MLTFVCPWFSHPCINGLIIQKYHTILLQFSSCLNPIFLIEFSDQKPIHVAEK